MAVPFIDLQRFEPGFLDRWAEICARITRQTQFVGGPEVARLEESLRQRGGAASVVACANGTDAIQLALRAVGVGPGDTVLLPDATFWATFEAVVNVGARPVTVDISMEDLQLDLDRFREAVDLYKPKAAIIVHLYGWASRHVRQFRSLCREKNIRLVEDAAQAFDVKIDGEPIFAGAEIATLSFYPAKVLGACGDAGAVYCSTKEMGDMVRLLGNHGRTSHYGHGYVGWNSRMGGFDAAFLNLSLEFMDARLESRRRAAEKFRARFRQWNICHVGPPAGVTENAYLSVALVDPDKREKVQAVLKERGIGFGVVYPGAMSRQPGAAAWIGGKVGGEKADLLSRSVLNLPLFAYMRDEEVEESLAAFRDGLRAAGIANG